MTICGGYTVGASVGLSEHVPEQVHKFGGFDDGLGLADSSSDSWQALNSLESGTHHYLLPIRFGKLGRLSAGENVLRITSTPQTMPENRELAVEFISPLPSYSSDNAFCLCLDAQRFLLLEGARSLSAMVCEVIRDQNVCMNHTNGDYARQREAMEE